MTTQPPDHADQSPQSASPWPFAWQPDDRDDQLHVAGTHDINIARRHAAVLARHELELNEQETDVMLAADPQLWWSLPVHNVADDGDMWFPRVPAGTAGAVPITTWELPDYLP